MGTVVSHTPDSFLKQEIPNCYGWRQIGRKFFNDHYVTLVTLADAFNPKQQATHLAALIEKC